MPLASEEAHPTPISETQVPSIEEDQPTYIEETQPRFIEEAKPLFIAEAQPTFIEEAQPTSIEDPNAYNEDCLPSPLKNSDYFIGWGSSDGGRSPDSIENPSPPDIDYSSIEAMLEMTRKVRDEFRISYPKGSLEKLTDVELEKVWRCPRKWSSAVELRMGTIPDCNDVVDIATTSEVGNRNSNFLVLSLLKKKRHATSGKKRRCKRRKELQGSTIVARWTEEKQSKNAIIRLEGLLSAVSNQCLQYSSSLLHEARIVRKSVDQNCLDEQGGEKDTKTGEDQVES